MDVASQDVRDNEDPDRMEVNGIHVMVEGTKAHGVSRGLLNLLLNYSPFSSQRDC